MGWKYPLLIAAFALPLPSGTLAALEPPGLMPRIGETAQEFEARKRGIKPDDSRHEVVTVAADRNGHFFVEPILDGQQIRMVVDTGATVVALTQEDSERIGAKVLPRDFRVQMSTANGIVSGAPVRIGAITIGNVVVRNVEAIVLPKGKLEVSLLGMSFLKRLSGFDIARGQLSLRN